MRKRKQGGPASGAPGETESRREDHAEDPGTATSRRDTDGGWGGAGSRAAGGAARSPPGLEGVRRGLKIARGWGSALRPAPVSASVWLNLSVFRSVSHQPLPPRAGHAPPARAWLMRVSGRPPAPRGDREASWGRGRPWDPRALGAGAVAGVAGALSGASARSPPLPQARPSQVPSRRSGPQAQCYSPSGQHPRLRGGGAGAGPAPQGAQTPTQGPRAQSW